MGVLVVKGGQNLPPPLVGIGFTDLATIGRASGLPGSGITEIGIFNSMYRADGTYLNIVRTYVSFSNGPSSPSPLN